MCGIRIDLCCLHLSKYAINQALARRAHATNSFHMEDDLPLRGGYYNRDLSDHS